MKGTAFQIKVWKYIKTIPIGKTITYKQLALLFGRLGEHHSLYPRSAEYAQKYLESRKEDGAGN